MIFSELYSAYYKAVAKILEAAQQGTLTDEEMRRLVAENAFSESALAILPALKTEKWQLLYQDGTTPLKHKPTMPLTDLEKRWLKAILLDPRIQLFGVDLPLEDVKPLFTQEDIRMFDRYNDGDPFTDPGYIARFRLMLDAIRARRPVLVTMIDRKGKLNSFRFYPQRLEYSAKDDKFRVMVTGCKYGQFNLGKLITCEYYPGDFPSVGWPEPDRICQVTLLIEDERNALERVMLHFAHFEKRAERVDEKHYLAHIRYYETDETEIVIRVLSFGPRVRVVEPGSFVELIKKRLIAQKNCGLR